MPGKPPTMVRVDGRWTMTPRADGRIEVRFAPEVIDGPPGDLPSAGDVQAPIQLALHDGVLTGLTQSLDAHCCTVPGPIVPNSLDDIESRSVSCGLVTVSACSSIDDGGRALVSR